MNARPLPIYWFLVLAILSGAACFARTATPALTMPESMRVIEGGRKLLIVWPEPGLDILLASNVVQYSADGEGVIMLNPGQSVAAFNAMVGSRIPRGRGSRICSVGPATRRDS